MSIVVEKKKHGLEVLLCNDGCGGTHTGFWRGIPSYVCEQCNSTYILEVVCMEKNCATNFGVYLKTVRIDSRENFDDFCDVCMHPGLWIDPDSEETCKKIPRNKLGQMKLIELAALQTPHDECKEPRVERDDFCWSIMYEGKAVLSFSLAGHKGQASFE